ncbi:cupin domain-containing protein [Caulobacter sp. AP07]|uniref:cupin domain-containing protein n=1 Tax=Caulobacter sp. AP07 TaxID=1144304 RepID=UPI0002720C62|nr:cupin domain-containing protein [Caulobacter sp. AP07]EJL27343.1 cupin domain-containing protein [Caulobacter sp. AP07]
MNVTRFETATEYFPPNHHDMRCLRLQGHEAGPADSLWLGVSVIAPGGHVESSASPLEKHYVVLEGELTLSTGAETAVLKAFDSCRMAPGEPREIRNHSSQPAKILLAMPFPPVV